MSAFRLNRSLLSPACLLSAALFFVACGESADPPGMMNGTAGSPASAGTTSGSGNAIGGGGSSTAGSAGSSPASAGTAGTAVGGSSAGAAGTPNGGAPGGAGGGSGVAGAAGSGGMGGAGGGAAGGGAAGSNAGGSGGTGGAPAFQPCPATGTCKIMPFGDSITQGYNVNGGYRAPLFHLALAASHDITFVGSANDYSVPTVDGKTFPKNHEGHGGFTIEGNNGIAKYVASSIPSYKPNIITLMIGTNDINGNVNVADAPNRLGKLLDSIFARDPNILVILAQMVPTANDGTNNAVKTYNAAMPNLVSMRVAQGQHIVLVDMYTAFTSNASYKQALLGDNLHPNQAGYNLMADVWFKALAPYLH